MIEEIDASVKENIKSEKILAQCFQEIWDTMKRPSLKIKGIEKGEETQVKDIESDCNKIIEEHFPNLKKEMPIKGQESHRTSDRLDQKRKSSWHIIKN